MGIYRRESITESDCQNSIFALSCADAVPTKTTSDVLMEDGVDILACSSSSASIGFGDMDTTAKITTGKADAAGFMSIF